MKDKKESGVLKSITGGVSKIGTEISDMASTAGSKTQQAIMGTLDINDDGELDISDIITLSLKTKGSLVERDEFLAETFSEHYSDEIVEIAITHGPKAAGIPQKKIDKIAGKISKQKNKLISGVVTKHVMPKKVSAVTAIPTDIILYYAHVLLTTQKLLYLYGFPKLKNRQEQQELSLEAITLLSVCLGTMYEIEGASAVLKEIVLAGCSHLDGEQVQQILNSEQCELVIERTNKWFAINIFRGVLGRLAKSTVPVVGKIVGKIIAPESLKTDFDLLIETLSERD